MSILNPSRLPDGRHAPCITASLALLLAGALALPTTAVQAAACTQDNQNGCVELSASPAQDTVAVPPNIMLILDDSGSMLWNFMPDWGYLPGGTSDAALINSQNNGVYYNPAVTYKPPPMADGTLYPAPASLTNVRIDGFGMRTTDSTNLYTYTGSTTESYSSGGGVATGNKVPYNTGKKTYSGDTVNNYNQTGVNKTTCKSTFDSYNDPSNQSAWAYSWKSNKSGTCTFKYGTAYSYFQYAIGPATGPHTLWYVASNSQGCHASEARCVKESDTSGKVAPAGIKAGTNIGNWFAYYHTRFLMAKSGLMAAFSPLSANYRLGYGSLNKTSSYVGVSRYGDGSSGSRKASFWTWLEGTSNNGGTPLRNALAAAGAYYMTADPWKTMEGDPNYVVGGQNDEELTCRSSYTILTTDGFWNGNNPNSKYDKAASIDGTEYQSPSGAKLKYEAIAPFSGGSISGNKASLADVAAYYWKTDLRTTANLVPTTQSDPAFWQHMTTFTMGMGFDPVDVKGGTPIPIDGILQWARAGGGAANRPSTVPSNFSWPTPAEDTINTSIDLAHAAVTGHGDFFSAKNPEELAAGFARAIAQIAERNVAPQPKSANASVAVIGALSFDTGYNTGNWSGTLEAVEMKPDGSRGQVKWDITDILDLRLWSSRKVYTATYAGVDCTNPLAPTGGSFGSGKVFDPSVYGSLDCWQAAGLTSPALGGGVDTVSNRIDFLRGDDTYEVTQPNGVYRRRAHKLGAIIRSQPVYVAYPSEGYYDNWPAGSPEETAANNGDGYSKFQVDHANREGTVYIGANDGMLHAFSAPAPVCDYSDPANPTCTYASSGGMERWAFVPRAVYANLGNLTNANFNFRPTVDGTPRTRDVFINSKWTSLLAGGIGLGGRGVYALDITDPTAFNAGKVLWEFDADMKIGTGCYATHGACRATDLGYTTASPYIGRLHNNKWVVLVPTGYFPDCSQPDVPTNEPEYGTKPLCEAIAAQAPVDAGGKPYSALFVLDAQTGAVIAELKTPTNIAGVSSHGLGPAVLGDYESDQLDDVAFAGDLMGNLWRFDLSDPSPTNWKVSLAYMGITGTGNKQGVQPITVQPRLFPDPWSSRFMVVFGTGKYLGAGDNSASIPVQSAYGIRETLDSHGNPVTVLRSNLKAQTLTEVSGTGALTGAKLRKLTDDALADTHKGWYFDFSIAQAQGERVVVTPGAIFPTNGAVFTTMIPTKDNYCDPSTKGAVMLANAANGGAGSGVSMLGGLAFVGARVTNVGTSGSTALVSKLGGGGVYLPMLIDTAVGGAPPSPLNPSPILILDAPVWRRRSWADMDNGQ